MWKGIVKKQIRKGASYEEDFVSKTKDNDFEIYVRSDKANIDITDERATLEWTGSIEVYSAGFGALSSSSDKLTLEIEYVRMGEGDEWEEMTKEFVFTGDFKDEGKGNPSDVTVHMNFSDFNNPKIKKVKVEYEGRFNE